MSKINRILVVLIAVLVVAVIVIGVFWYLRGGMGNNYYAVYMETGDLYFGSLSRFPHLSLNNVWYLQRDVQDQRTSVQDFSKAAWGPENKIGINKDKVVWMAKISDVSPLMPILSGSQTPLSQYQPSQEIPSEATSSAPSN